MSDDIEAENERLRIALAGAEFQNDVLRVMAQRNVRIEEALEWYAGMAADCRKVTSSGDYARQAIDQDGGKLARDALKINK